MVVTPSPRGDTLAARLLLEAHGRRLLREGLEADARGRAPHQLQLLRAPLPLLLLLLLLLLLRLRGEEAEIGEIGKRSATLARANGRAMSCHWGRSGRGATPECVQQPTP